MLLKQLLVALATRQRRRDGRIIAPSIPATRIDNSEPLPIRFDAAYQGILAKLEGDELAQAFEEMPAPEQLKLIEAELALLPAEDVRRVSKALAAYLGKPWLPLPGPQYQAYHSEADVLLYGGAGGGGKSDLLLGLAMTAHERSLILRRQYTDLSFLTERLIQINRGRQGYNGSAPPSLKTVDGKLIEFGAVQHLGDEERWQGRPHDLLGFDEAAHFLESQVRFLMGWVRSTTKGQRTRVVLVSNPPLSDEGQWLVRMFRPWLDLSHPRPAKPGELRWFITDVAGEDVEVEGPGPHRVGTENVLALSRTFIPARLEDNPYLVDTDYRRQLDSLEEPLRSAVRDGNFMAVRRDDAWQVIPSDWVRKAQARWKERPPEGQTMTCVGVDVAQGGADQTVLASRHGTWFAPLLVKKGSETPDGLSVAGLIFVTMRDACQIVVDMGGGYGGDTVSHLKRQNIAVEGFKGSDGSIGKAKGSGQAFANRRAETWWRLREALDPINGDSIALPPDPELLSDLCTPRLDARAMEIRGVIQVESKEEIRKRLGRSPDRGDAIVMAWAYGGKRELELKNLAKAKMPPALVSHAHLKRHAQRR